MDFSIPWHTMYPYHGIMGMYGYIIVWWIYFSFVLKSFFLSFFLWNSLNEPVIFHANHLSIIYIDFIWAIDTTCILILYLPDLVLVPPGALTWQLGTGSHATHQTHLHILIYVWLSFRPKAQPNQSVGLDIREKLPDSLVLHSSSCIITFTWLNFRWCRTPIGSFDMLIVFSALFHSGNHIYS